MRLREFRAICVARFGDGWQSKLAAVLRVNPRTVRRWAAGAVPIPTAVVAFLGAAPAIARDYPDEWLIAADADETREYVVHLSPPRFVGMVLDPDSISDGVTISVGDEVIGEISWIDPAPKEFGEMIRSLRAAMDLYWA